MTHLSHKSTINQRYQWTRSATHATFANARTKVQGDQIARRLSPPTAFMLLRALDRIEAYALLCVAVDFPRMIIELIPTGSLSGQPWTVKK